MLVARVLPAALRPRIFAVYATAWILPSVLGPALAAHYVGRVTPHAHQTDGRTWTVTALPSTYQFKHARRLSTLSINNVEVAILGEQLVDDEWHPWARLNTALAPAPPLQLDGLHQTASYRSAGTVRASALDGLPLPEMLDEPSILRAARSLALGQLRKGGTKSSRFHNDSLADAIFLRIQEDLDTKEAQ